MKRQNPSSESNDEGARKRARTEFLDSWRPRVTSVESASFPAPVSHLVGEYLPINERYYAETAFAGVQSITLCLSQDVGSKHASCWSIGFLPPDCQWEPSDVKIDKEYLIQDYEGCLQLLEQEDLYYCRATIEVLVVKLSKTSKDLPMALKDLRKTIEELWRHLPSVKHVVISIEEYASCCFTLNDTIGMVDEMRPSVDKSTALFEIIDDLDICWSKNQTLTVHQLFAFYFNSGAKPSSDMYLAKFVIPLKSDLNRALFDDEASKTLSTKIMWIQDVNTLDDLKYLSSETMSRCHAIRLLGYKYEDKSHLKDLSHLFSLEDNLFIERIVIHLGYHDGAVNLPRPSAPLTDATPRSALRELTLAGKNNMFDLKQLNNGHFPNLVRLSITDGGVTGHLDSQNVPRLTTLILELEGCFNRACPNLGPPMRACCQSLIDTGRPWQLVAARHQSGWSLASYDDHTTNPQDEVKDDSPHSLPVIRELMLVMVMQKNADEWYWKLKGKPSLEAAARNHDDGVLVWARDRVERITAFSTSERSSTLKFKDEIPGQTRILTFLTLHNVNATLKGAALPHLQSLEVHGGEAKMSGAFLELRRLSFQETRLRSPWEVSAPLLESLDCQNLKDGRNLSLCPALLPHLSYLRIELFKSDHAHYPKIFVNESRLGLSHVKRVVLENGMTLSPCFNQGQVHLVLDLELTVNPLRLPACWENTEWQCETLTIDVYVVELDDEDPMDAPDVVVLPLLPQVKKLTATKRNCGVLLDREMLELTDCKVPSPKSLGPNLKCPKLTYICFSENLSDIEKAVCLDRATYVAIGARPRWVYFSKSGEANFMSWDMAPSATGESSFEGLLEEVY